MKYEPTDEGYWVREAFGPARLEWLDCEGNPWDEEDEPLTHCLFEGGVQRHQLYETGADPEGGPEPPCCAKCGDYPRTQAEAEEA